MSRHPWSKITFKESSSPERQIRSAQHSSAITTAQELGKLLDDSNSSSLIGECLEYDEGVYLAALREDIKVLGGELEVKAVFPDQTIKLVPNSQD